VLAFGALEENNVSTDFAKKKGTDIPGEHFLVSGQP
jgi:hypothetical protein